MMKKLSADELYSELFGIVDEAMGAEGMRTECVEQELRDGESPEDLAPDDEYWLIRREKAEEAWADLRAMLKELADLVGLRP